VTVNWGGRDGVEAWLAGLAGAGGVLLASLAADALRHWRRRLRVVRHPSRGGSGPLRAGRLPPGIPGAKRDLRRATSTLHALPPPDRTGKRGTG